MPTSPKKRCSPGKIMRVAYTRKAYTRADGTRVKACRVAARCVKDMGAKGKGKKTLPPPKDDGFLTSLGYRLHKPVAEREAALRRAVRKHGGLAVIRHLNLIRNYAKNMPTTHAKYTRDLEYVSKLYKQRKAKGTARPVKRSKSPTKRRSPTKKRSKSPAKKCSKSPTKRRR